MQRNQIEKPSLEIFELVDATYGYLNRLTEGRVGKTSTAISLAAGLARRGIRLDRRTAWVPHLPSVGHRAATGRPYRDGRGIGSRTAGPGGRG